MTEQKCKLVEAIAFVKRNNLWCVCEICVPLQTKPRADERLSEVVKPTPGAAAETDLNGDVITAAHPADCAYCVINAVEAAASQAAAASSSSTDLLSKVMADTLYPLIAGPDASSSSSSSSSSSK